MTHILLTGIATLDIINQLDHYPVEDSEVRAQNQSIRIGGNASNSAIVLQQLGMNSHLLAKRADDVNANLIFSELENRQIDTSLCPVQANSTTPTSYITLNSKNGSRSIIHYRNLAELQAADFIKLDLSQYSWLHFEARDCLEQTEMLLHAQSFKIPISIELEKNRDSIDDIMPFADILLLSKPFAESRGFTTAVDCLQDFSRRFKNKTITCTWGESGAWAYSHSEIIHQNAYKVAKPVETLGAGDTFNAGIITSLVRQENISQALSFACKLAAYKCQQTGLDLLTIPD